MRYINLNGNILPSNTAVFKFNRAMNYGDGFFESIRVLNGKILFLKDHFQRMIRAMEALQFSYTNEFSLLFINKQINDLLSISEVSGNARIRIAIFRSGGGLYEPLLNHTEYYIEILPDNAGDVWKEATCKLGVFTEVRKDYSTVSFFKSMNSLPYVMASIFKRKQLLGDCLLLNSHGNVVEAISSNIFWYKDGIVFTPPISAGCIDGIMRKNLILVIIQNGIAVREQLINSTDLENAEEIFLTNVSWCIRPVTEYATRKLKTDFARSIFEKALANRD